MALQVGLNVIEVDGSATVALQPAPTSVAAFVGVTSRGVPNRPMRVTGADQLATRTGATLAGAYLAPAATGFFLNGGREAYVVRVVGAGSGAAHAGLSDRRTPPPGTSLRVVAAYRGEPDPGAWGEALRLDLRDDPRAVTTVTGALAATARQGQLASIAGVQAGSVLRFATGAGNLFRVVSAVDSATATVSWSDTLGAAVDADTVVTTCEFRLVVRQRDPLNGTFPVAEEWAGLSMNPQSRDYAPGRVNHPLTGSRFVLLEDRDLGVHPGENVPAVVSGVALEGANEVAPTAGDLIGSAAARTGLFALDTVAVQLVAVPDAHGLSSGAADVARAATDYCATRGDCMYVGSAPNRVGGGVGRVRDYLDAVRAFAGGLQGAKVYGALYAPWLVVPDPIGGGPSPRRQMPADGHVMGMYARTELERGIAKAPAGDAAVLRGVIEPVVSISDSENDELVRVGRTNGIRALPGRGVVVTASRTLSSDTRWLFVNVRLLFNFVKASLRDGLRFVRQEPHTDALRRSITHNVVTPFLLGLWRQGAFGSDPPAQVFTVKCDAENNPPSEVDQGNLRLEVYFYPVRPAETVRITVGQQPGAGTATEA